MLMVLPDIQIVMLMAKAKMSMANGNNGELGSCANLCINSLGLKLSLEWMMHVHCY